jgi:cytolethal distending toxin subunit A
MITFNRVHAGLVASGVFVLGLFCVVGAAVTQATPVLNEVMLVNGKTGKCLTIAGGVSTDNNVHTVQFDCDSHPSRRWMLREMGGGGIYQIRNVQTGKCLAIAGGTLTNNNIEGVQFDCEGDTSRTWTIRLKL